jgi:hypothetical protein
VKPGFLLSVILLLGAAAAFGQLKFEQDEIDLRAGVGDSKAIAQFHFSNTGKSAVEIKSIKTSCGCTTATARQNVYQPGEEGTIEVTLTIGDLRGFQRKTIIIETTDAKNPTKILLLTVEIPALAQFDPADLEWKIGSKRIAKSMQLKIADRTSAHLLDVKSTSSVLSINQKQISPKLYEITVTPTSTTAPLSALITATLDDDRVTSVSLPVRIRR